MMRRRIDFSDFDYYLSDIVTIIPLSTLLCRTKANQNLNKNLPRASFLNYEILSSLIVAYGISTIALFIGYKIHSTSIYSKEVAEVTSEEGQIDMSNSFFTENKYSIFYMNLLIIFYCFAFHRGYPFR